MIDWTSIGFIGLGMLLSILLKKLTVTAAIAGGALAVCIYAASGFPGIVLMAGFFIIGVAVTSWKKQVKQQSGLAENMKGKRNAAQVMANAGVPALCCIIAYLFPQYHLNAPLFVAAAFASATADTVSSELGNVYGSKYYNIVTLKKDNKGKNGVISLEGTLSGMAGSIIIAFIYSIYFGMSIHFVWIIVAGTLGNVADSLLGATLENRGILGNNTVNFLNTLVAVLLIILVQ